MPKPYHWFGPESTEALRDALNAAGPAAILEVHQDGQDMTLFVRGAAAITAAGGINDSHLCPPDCGPH